jgi:calcineurin-like phosphoesterase
MTFMVEAEADHAPVTGDIFQRVGRKFLADSLTVTRAESEAVLTFINKRFASEIIVYR